MNIPIISNFLVVAEQVGIVFIIVLLGYLGGKTGLISDKASDGMANIAVYYVTPALVIMAFQRSFEIELLHGFLITLAGNLLAVFFCIAVGYFALKKGPCEQVSVLRASSVFGNIGMMALPLQQALFGADGVFYCAASIAAFNLTFWTYCSIAMGKGKKSKDAVKRGLLNPGLIGTLVGLLLFFFSAEIPSVLSSSMNNLANLNMPMCMLVIGQRLSKIPLNTLFDDKDVWKTAAIRLLFAPLVMSVALWFFGVSGPVAVCLVISVSAPAAASVNMLASAYKQDVELAAKTVSMHTLIAMITMPTIIAVVYGWLM